jgi:hypothetical protein
MIKPWFLRTVEDWDREMKTGSKQDLIITVGHATDKETNEQPQELQSESDQESNTGIDTDSSS